MKSSNDIYEDGSDTKISCTELTVLKRLSREDFFLHSLAYMADHPLREWNIHVRKDRAEAYRGYAIVRGIDPAARGKTGDMLAFAKEDPVGNLGIAPVLIHIPSRVHDVIFRLIHVGIIGEAVKRVLRAVEAARGKTGDMLAFAKEDPVGGHIVQIALAQVDGEKKSSNDIWPAKDICPSPAALPLSGSCPDGFFSAAFFSAICDAPPEEYGPLLPVHQPEGIRICAG